METEQQTENINECLAQIRGEINILKIVLSHCAISKNKSVQECIDRINSLQQKADDLYTLLHGVKNVHAELIYNATCEFCTLATKHLCKTQGCKKAKPPKVCKVCKMFESLYELFK